MIELSLLDARRKTLKAQGLFDVQDDNLKVLENLGYVQIDTISVVERAHHHVFWSRNPSYRPGDLHGLIESRRAFEYWAHAAAVLPMRDYRFTWPRKKRFAMRKKEWPASEKKIMKNVYDRIRAEGPLASKDFSSPGRTTAGWWDWKPAKIALERLFLSGELEIAQRKGFQKIYDLPERVIPNSVDTREPSSREYIRYLIERTLRQYGFASVDEIAYLLRGDVKLGVRKELKKMLADGDAVSVRVEKISEEYFAFPGGLEAPKSRRKSLHILSPFDNSVIQRKRLKTLFGFDYQIECYVPEAKRKFGYFCLPLLHGDRFVGRLDAKADRPGARLLVQSLHFEAGVDRDELLPALRKTLRTFAEFNGCRQFEF